MQIVSILSAYLLLEIMVEKFACQQCSSASFAPHQVSLYHCDIMNSLTSYVLFVFVSVLVPDSSWGLCSPNRDLIGDPSCLADSWPTFQYSGITLKAILSGVLLSSLQQPDKEALASKNCTCWIFIIPTGLHGFTLVYPCLIPIRANYGFSICVYTQIHVCASSPCLLPIRSNYE